MPVLRMMHSFLSHRLRLAELQHIFRKDDRGTLAILAQHLVRRADVSRNEQHRILDVVSSVFATSDSISASFVVNAPDPFFLPLSVRVSLLQHPTPRHWLVLLWASVGAIVGLEAGPFPPMHRPFSPCPLHLLPSTLLQIHRRFFKSVLLVLQHFRVTHTHPPLPFAAASSHSQLLFGSRDWQHRPLSSCRWQHDALWQSLPLLLLFRTHFFLLLDHLKPLIFWQHARSEQPLPV